MRVDMIYLASLSPRRRELLQQIGIAHELLPVDANEDLEALEVARSREAPARYVRRVAALKLEAALDRMRRLALPLAPILCADTTVALGREILGKPDDAKEAVRMLKRIAGTTHRVLTAVSLGYGRRRLHALSESHVTFAAMTSRQMLDYVRTGEPFGKAGAYGIQGHAAMFISHIRGSYSGVMGLPLFETVALLRQIGWMR